MVYRSGLVRSDWGGLHCIALHSKLGWGWVCLQRSLLLLSCYLKKVVFCYFAGDLILPYGLLYIIQHGEFGHREQQWVLDRRGWPQQGASWIKELGTHSVCVCGNSNVLSFSALHGSLSLSHGRQVLCRDGYSLCLTLPTYSYGDGRL